MAMNLCVFQGNFVDDPSVSRGTTKDGKDYVKATFKLGVSRFNKDEADFPRFYCFGHTAEFVERNFKKGSAAIVEASFETDSYTDKDGKKVFTDIFRANKVDFS